MYYLTVTQKPHGYAQETEESQKYHVIKMFQKPNTSDTIVILFTHEWVCSSELKIWIQALYLMCMPAYCQWTEINVTFDITKININIVYKFNCYAEVIFFFVFF